MSAINLHIGTQAEDDRTATLACSLDQQPLEAARACVPELAATHNGLTKMLWIRRSLEDILSSRSYYIANGSTLGHRGARERTKLYFVLDPPVLQDDIPWMPGAREIVESVAMIGESGKMRCPTWDLPAGSMLTGGACPGATAGQSIIPLEVRRKAEPAVGGRVNISTTICQICYAEGGQYASPHVQLGELVRYWWCRQMMEGGRDNYVEWVETMVRAIEGEIFPAERPLDPRTGQPILPMRVHSSGDFFSPAYARGWIEVCNRLPEAMFWAPTRTWAAPGWVEHWRKLVPTIRHGNLVIRPSAYHTGDPAPSAAQHPWPGDYPLTAAGTTAIYKFDDAGSEHGHSRDPRYDWQCQTYSILDDAHSCQNALSPDGQVGCRACWIRPDLRVNYTAH